MTNGGNNIVPLFLDFATLQRQEHEIQQEFVNDWNAAYQRLDAVIAVIKSDQGELAKLATDDVDLAKTFVQQHGDRAKSEVVRETGLALIAAARRRDERLYGVTELAKRSRRFAAAVDRRYRDPASAIISMEGKR